MATTSSTSKTPKPTISGSCLCTEVKYSLTDDPAVKMICHCTHCKKATGSTYLAFAIYSKPQFTITHGKDHLKTYTSNATESGNTVKRFFCGDCGSSVYGTKSDKDDIVFVTIGTMEGVAGWKPVKEMFCRSRFDWIPEIEGAEQFHAMM